MSLANHFSPLWTDDSTNKEKRHEYSPVTETTILPVCSLSPWIEWISFEFSRNKVFMFDSVWGSFDISFDWPLEIKWFWVVWLHPHPSTAYFEFTQKIATLRCIFSRVMANNLSSQ